MAKSSLALSFISALLVTGSLSAQAVADAPAADRALGSLLGNRQTLGLDARHTFQRTGITRDELGQVHTRFQQHFNGVRVWEGDVIAHEDARGGALPHTLDLRRNIEVGVVPGLGEPEILAIVHRDLDPKGPYSAAPALELVVYPHMETVPRLTRSADAFGATAYTRQVSRYSLAYHVHADLFNGREETRSMDYIVDAQTGEILQKWNNLHTAAAVGTGKSQWYGTVNLNTNSVTSGFEMRDMTRGTGGTFGNNITTNLNHATSGNGTIYTDADNAWGDGLGYGSGTTVATTSATGQTAAVDQHHGMAVTWDFYKNVLGRNGINNAGKAAYGRMHYSSNYDNAFWDDSCFCMTYGDGAPPSGSYGEADLDTVGHEMSHGVCATTANLTYSGESGGLNEANSDIFGTCVEFYALGAGGTGSVVPDAAGTGTVTANYMMFENSWGHAGQALRYMYKPSLDGASPDAWSSTLKNLDVHYSSGPMNRAWYFLAKGATTTGNTSTTYLPSGMTGIGNDHACRIWYRALTTYLTASSNYAAARSAAISAAKDLYGAGSAEEQAVWNAFHGINVGVVWSGTVTAPAITTQPASATVAAGAAATFTVVASGGSLSYQWYRNGAAVSGATAASYTTAATTSADNGATFYVKVTNTAGSVTSSTATLTVTSTTTAPAITSQPANKTVAVGATAAFSVTATGTAPLAYQWYRNGAAVSGATAATYTTAATTSADNGATFYVKVSNAAGSVTSSTATLTVTSTTTTERILNGTFEGGATSWTATSGTIGTFTKEPAYAGTKNLVMGGKGKTLTQTAYQTVTLPSTVTTATLSFQLHIDTAETSTTAYDKLTVVIQNNSGTALATLATYSNANKATGYALKSFDVSAYKGQTIRVYFKGTEDSSLQTSFAVDNVSLLTK